MIARRIAAVLQAAALVWAVGARPALAGDKAGDFDYLALTLSWSPTYCAGNDGQTDREQCASGRRYAFVAHGLWPQHERGWPEYCDTNERFVPQQTIDGMLAIMPSKRLVIHEWRKHGTCYGTQQAYFSATSTLFGQIRVPARYLSPQAPIFITPGQLAADFVKTNRWLEADMISIQCGNARDRANLRELRICFDRSLKPRACGSNERRACRARQLVLPPVR